MDCQERITRADWIVGASLALAALVLYIPFRSRLPYHWDSAEFALAINDYNIVHSQPHAPGYFLYVMLGRLVNNWVGDPHASLVWVSVVAGSLLAPVMYVLGRTMFDRRTGVIAALLTLTSPPIWFHSEVALTYIVDGLLVSLAVLVCWRAMARGGKWSDSVMIGMLLAVIGGVRQQEVVALGPVVLYTVWRFDQQRALKLAVIGAVTLGLGLAWFLPMVRLAGGLTAYLEIVRRHAAFNAAATWAGGGSAALIQNVFTAGLFSANGLMLGGFALLAGLCYRVFGSHTPRQQAWDATQAQPFQFLMAWVGGMFLLATAVGFVKQPGYVLNFLPGLLLAAAVVVAQWRGRPAVMATVVICAFNVFAFVAWPRSWDGVFAGRGRTARELHEHDQRLATAVAVVRSRFRPADTVVLHAREYLDFGFKQFQYLMPEFDQYQYALDSTMLTPPGRPMLAARDGHLRFVADVEWEPRQTVVLIVPPGLTAAIFEKWLDVRQAQPVAGSGGMGYQMPMLKSP